MANYSAIKAAVNAYIKENGRKEITGRILNAVLTATIDSLGKFFQFAGVATPSTDPEDPDQNVCYLAGEPGTYVHFDNITLENEEIALLFYDGEWTKQRMLLGIQEVSASVDNNVGTPSVDVSYSEGSLVLTFHNLKGDQGNTGAAAGFGTVGATVDSNIGTPGVSVQTSGPDTAKNLMFNFTNLKGETGVTSVVATVDNTTGTPSCAVSLVGGVLTLAFTGLKGLQGDTGVSADYPITIVNNLTTDDPTSALSAAMGVQLEGEITQLEQKVIEIEGGQIVVDSQNPINAESIYADNQIKVSTTGITLASAEKYSNAGFRNFRIYCKNASRITYNIFYTTSGYGSCFVDENDVIIAGHYFPSGTTSPQTVSVPSNAEYFIWSIRPGDGKTCTIIYQSKIEGFLPVGTATFRKGSVTIGADNRIVVASANNRLVATRYIDVADIHEIGIDDGYLFNAMLFDSSLVYLGSKGYDSSFSPGNVVVSGAKYVFLTIKKTDDSNIADGDTGNIAITYTTEAPKNLEDISCCGVSLKSLFLDSNLVKNGDLLSTTDWTNFNVAYVNYDSGDLSTNKSFSASSSMSRIYQSISVKEGHKYLVACEARITGVNSTIESASNNILDYSGGSLQNNRAMGIVFNSKPYGVSVVAKDTEYATIVGVIEIPVEHNYGDAVSKNYNIGNGGVNSMIYGLTRNAVLIDITDATFTSQPTRKDLFNAFRRYCEYVKCNRVADMNLEVSIEVEPTFCDSDAKRAYMSEMNKIAEELGCTQTDLRNPSGVYFADHKTTCRDYIKVGAMAMTENSFLRIINRHSMDVPVVHADGTSGLIVPTEVAEYSGATGEASAVLNDSYDIVSAKTGTWNGGTNASKTQTLVMIVRSKTTGKFIVGYIHNGGANYSTTWDDNKYNYMKNLFDKVEDDSVVLSLGTTSEWSAGYIPASTQWAKYVDFGTVKNADTTQFPPASTTKYLTCMIALQHLKENEVVEYDILDFSTGSGAAITAGDKFSVRDAVYLCMASSSNSLANMLARYTGRRLMEENNR